METKVNSNTPANGLIGGTSGKSRDELKVKPKFKNRFFMFDKTFPERNGNFFEESNITKNVDSSLKDAKGVIPAASITFPGARIPLYVYVGRYIGKDDIYN